MDGRYTHKKIAYYFSNRHKLSLWQKTELAAIAAMVKMGTVKLEIYKLISLAWSKNPINIGWWKKRDKEIHHDLNAFLDERIRHLDKNLHEFVHPKLTSFDTQEPAFARIIIKCLDVVDELYFTVEDALIKLAKKYRFTIMNARTHGQEAELQTFGARCLTWLKQLRVAYAALNETRKSLAYSKLSGAIGKYGSIDPELEKTALAILGFKPFYGATQIMPRVVYAPIAQALFNVIKVLGNIAMDIRLNARSSRPLMREPFKKKQKGSSAMPHKKNPIRLEQIEGMVRMAQGYLNMILDNIGTWEERAIEQSCVERVAWPDLFHVITRSLKVVAYCLGDLKVYPDNMLQEIYESRGTYASSEAKEFLKKLFAESGLGYEDAYRAVQLACFNVFEPSPVRSNIRQIIAGSFQEAGELLGHMQQSPPEKIISIQELIPQGQLRVSDELDIKPEDVEKYNAVLKEIFSKNGIMWVWNQIFEPAYLLKNEEVLYQEILGEEMLNAT